MNLINNSSKFFLAIFLMMNLSNTYAAKTQVLVAKAMEAVGAEAVDASGVEVGEDEAVCCADETFNVAAAISED